jgi:hypothetical protein
MMTVLSLLYLAAVDDVILWRTQVGAALRRRGCPPAFGLLLDAAALSATPT